MVPILTQLSMGESVGSRSKYIVQNFDFAAILKKSLRLCFETIQNGCIATPLATVWVELNKDWLVFVGSQRPAMLHSHWMRNYVVLE